MDKVEQLYNLYLQKGIITNATTLDMFRAANSEQQSALYNLGKQKDLFQTTDYSTFQSAWSVEEAPVKKKDQSGTTASPSEGWRFTPSGASQATFQWYQGTPSTTLTPTPTPTPVASLCFIFS